MEVAQNEQVNLNVSYDNKTFEEVGTTKFLGLQISNSLN
jgi:hypothetical protein